MSLYEFSDYVGLFGVVIILIAYFLVQSEMRKPSDVLIPWLNLVGALGILFSLYFHWNLSSVVIEVAWVAISVYSLMRNLSFANKRTA